MKRKTIGTIAAVGIVVAGIGLFELSGWLKTGHIEESVPDAPVSTVPTEPSGQPEVSEEEGEPRVIHVETYSQEYPVGQLIIVQDRQEYVSGSMTLEIPRIDFSGPVYAGPVSEETLPEGSGGVSNDVLDQGVGLFGLSQMPGLNNANVAIAGHRDIHGMEFYDIDKITEGDLMHLTYGDRMYTYEYIETTVVEPDDWSMIRVRDFGCLTLQSCEPINVASHRIFVVAKLIQVTNLNVPE